MNLSEYSTALSALVLLLGTTTLLSLLGYFFSPALRTKLMQIRYETWLKSIGILSTIATAGALIYQYIYLTPVCHLCWWQRIFMFPIEVIIAVTLFTRAKNNHWIIGMLVVMGLPISAYHYYTHYQKYVVGNPLLIPCSTNPLEISCTNSPIVTFGFITIPFMALIVFITLLWLVYLAHQKFQEKV